MPSTQSGASDQSNRIIIRDTTVEEAFKAAPYLTYEDKREMLALGQNPLVSLPLSVSMSEHPIAFEGPLTGLLGFAGVVPEDSGIGRVWMLTLDAVKKENPKLFLRQAREWLDSQPFTLLHNAADTRNTMHLKLLKMLGFKRLATFPAHPHNQTFVEFAKLCAPQ